MNFLELITQKNIEKKRKILEIKNLQNKYDNKVFINNLSFTVYRGEIFSIIGLSGSGKSTLLKLISGILPKSGGKVRFWNRGLFWIKNLIGYSPQEDSFFNNLTIKENIILFSEILGVNKKKGIERGRRLLEIVKMKEYLNEECSNLSGGEKKRLNIILSCLHEPRLLILDEPFAGLDYYNRKILWDFIVGLKNKSTSIILTTHLLQEAQKYSSRMLILKDGKKFNYGTFKNIKKKIGFNYLYHIKFSRRLSKKNHEQIKHYLLLKNIPIIYNHKKEFQFSVKNEKEKEIISDYLKNKKLSFDEISFRKPNLDEVMLMSKNENY